MEILKKDCTFQMRMTDEDSWKQRQMLVHTFPSFSYSLAYIFLFPHIFYKYKMQ